jgi:hypothetical protein
MVGNKFQGEFFTKNRNECRTFLIILLNSLHTIFITY